MIFKLLSIRRKLREARKNPAGFAGEEAADIALGALLLPLVIAGVGLVAFFILGFTDLLGGPWWFFKLLFIIGMIIWTIFFLIFRSVSRLIKRSVSKGAERGINEIKKRQS